MKSTSRSATASGPRDEYPANAIRPMQSPGHAPYIDAYLADLREVAEMVRRGEIVSKGGRAQYR